MARPYVDPREIAAAMADAQLARGGVSKAAGPAEVRDHLVSAYLPVAAAIVEGFAPVAKGIGGTTAKVTRQMQKAEQQLARIAEQDRLREEAAAAMAQKIAGQARPPQSRELSDADMHRMRMVMAKVAEVDAAFAERMRQESGEA